MTMGFFPCFFFYCSQKNFGRFGWWMVEVFQQPLYIWPVLWSWSKQTAWSWFLSSQLNSGRSSLLVQKPTESSLSSSSHSNIRNPQLVCMWAMMKLFRGKNCLQGFESSSKHHTRVELNGWRSTYICCGCFVCLFSARIHGIICAQHGQGKRTISSSSHSFVCRHLSLFLAHFGYPHLLAQSHHWQNLYNMHIFITVTCACACGCWCMCNGISGWKHCLLHVSYLL